jgi:hypothetical protein
VLLAKFGLLQPQKSAVYSALDAQLRGEVQAGMFGAGAFRGKNVARKPGSSAPQLLHTIGEANIVQ